MTGWYCRKSPVAAVVQRGVEVLLDLRARDERLLQRLVVDLHARVGGVLGAVEGQVGAREQLGGVVGARRRARRRCRRGRRR